MNKEEQDCDTCKHCILEIYNKKTGDSIYRYECSDDCNYEPRDEVNK